MMNLVPFPKKPKTETTTTLNTDLGMTTTAKKPEACKVNNSKDNQLFLEGTRTHNECGNILCCITVVNQLGRNCVTQDYMWIVDHILNTVEKCSKSILFLY
jgi:hypothetical protein